MFEVIPAIDVSGGRLATLAADGPMTARSFDADPVAAAKALVAVGARRLHVVDLDLAFEGEPRNLGVVRAIADLGVAVQVAGGVRTGDEVRSLIGAGAETVVLGSGGLRDADTAASLIAAEGSRLIVGLEVDGDRIRSRGRDPVDLELMETLGWLVAAEARAFLVTSVARVGGLGGPDVRLVRRVTRSGRPVLAAGGISQIRDLEDLREAGAAGAVVGRAILDGSLDLARAIAEMG